MESVTVVGGGLAGTECAWQLAERGIAVDLVEQKPTARTAAQSTESLAELVCSNSFRGAALSNAVGLLKEEMRRACSLTMDVADRCRVPAGGALAVDRAIFSREVTSRIEAHPKIRRVVARVTAIPAARPLVLATGPLTDAALAEALAAALGSKNLAYYDAIAPVVTAESIDWNCVFRASRYDKGGDDAYVNCPLDAAQYAAFVQALLAAAQVAPHAFEEVRYFEGCLPIEVMAARGEQTLAFGPMKPVGLVDPKIGRRPFAVVQLRTEDAAATAYNLVGFQTRMTWDAQREVFRRIPGLERAEFVRLGAIHRNTFVNGPAVLTPEFELEKLPGVFLAGQITGVEGYVESAASGLVVGRLLAARCRSSTQALPPVTTALGALCKYVTTPRPDVQPSNVLWSMFPPLQATNRLGKRERHAAMAERALADLDAWLTKGAG